jgi:hypothetical protein
LGRQEGIPDLCIIWTTSYTSLNSFKQKVFVKKVRSSKKNQLELSKCVLTKMKTKQFKKQQQQQQQKIKL